MKRGDIVIAIFPHASGTPPKRRPALIVQADYYNHRITNVLLASITSNLARQKDAAHFFIDISSADGKQSGLNQDSLVSCLNIATMPTFAIGPKIGELPQHVMTKIDDCLRAAFGM